MGNDNKIRGMRLEMAPNGTMMPSDKPKGGKIYKTELIGKIAEGRGLKYGVPCRIVVDREWSIYDPSSPSIGISGRIMSENGKPGTITEVMGRGFLDEYGPVSWSIVGEYDEHRDDCAEQVTGSLTKRLIQMGVGETIKIDVSTKSASSVKTLCSRLSTAMHRKYTATGDGLVMEVSRVDSETYVPRPNFTDKIRSIEIGEEIDIPSSEKPTEMVRSIAGRLTVNMGRKYKVSRNETGCTVRRIK